MVRVVKLIAIKIKHVDKPTPLPGEGFFLPTVDYFERKWIFSDGVFDFKTPKPL
jgi:hypothetical protein